MEYVEAGASFLFCWSPFIIYGRGWWVSAGSCAPQFHVEMVTDTIFRWKVRPFFNPSFREGLFSVLRGPILPSGDRGGDADDWGGVLPLG